MKNYNQLWNFFASVKLALFTLCALSLTAIIGTIIPQGEPFARYVDEYGPALAQFFQVLDIPNMYSSWWFLGLLGLLSANLIICSVDRFPTTWRLITASQHFLSPERLGRMDLQETWNLASSPQETAQSLGKRLDHAGWRTSAHDIDGGLLLFSQKTGWSRLGVYLVHLSILIIFTGAIIGTFLGFKGTVMIPETESTDTIFASGTASPLELGFEIRCDSFTIEFYANGMPKEYRSHLTVREKGKDILERDIEVNNPLTYKGITFYQSSYEGYKDFLLKFTDSTDQKATTFKALYQKEMEWSDKGLRFGVINAETKGNQILRTKIWLRHGEQDPTTFWLEAGDAAEVKLGGRTFFLSAKQMYATGLQVAKDPGVWLVYCGCGLMLVGLYAAFFLSHRRLWLSLKRDSGPGTIVLFAGSANKNTLGFAASFAQLKDLLHPKG